MLGHEFTMRVERTAKNAILQDAEGREIREGDRLAVVPGTSRFCGTCFYCISVPDRPQLCSNRRVLGVNISCKDAPYFFGAFGDKSFVDVAKWYAYRLSPDFPKEMGGLIEPMAVASHALDRAVGRQKNDDDRSRAPLKGKSIVVQGAGPIGLLVTSAARLMGAGKIIAIERVGSRIKLCQTMGADAVIDIAKFPKREDRLKEVQSLTAGVGADMAFDCVGFPRAFDEGLRLVRRGGVYVEVGHYTDSGGVEIRPNLICRGDLDIVGSWSYPPTQFATSIMLLTENMDTIPFRKLITHVLPFSEASKGIEAIRSGEAVKVLLS
jgi:L-iditol 2-dehydrogenase